MTTTTFPADAAKRLTTWLETHDLGWGLGNEYSTCSIGAINLALNGELTNRIPDCMSEVTGRWVIRIQDAMPDGLRNSAEWKSLLPRAAGTGREHETERITIIMDWLFETVLPIIQPTADANGFGPQWRRMCDERTAKASWDIYGARAAVAALWASEASDYATDASRAASDSDPSAAWRAAAAARSVAKVNPDAWSTIDPCALLQRLIEA